MSNTSSTDFPLHNVFHHKAIKGFTVPPLSRGEDALSDLESQFTARPSDVVISTYPRSGTTWLTTLVYELVGAPNGPLKDLHAQCPWLEGRENIGPIIEELETIKSPRILKNHFRWSWLPEKMQQTCRFIYCYRNPKDQAVSAWQYQKLFQRKYGDIIKNFTFSEHFREIVTKEQIAEYGLWEDHVINWLQDAKNAKILYLTYEDLSENTERELRKIASFLGLEVTDERIAEILNIGSFKEMQNNPRISRVFDKKYADMKDKHPFVRKGKVGGWVEHVSEEESALFDEQIEKVRKAGGYIRCNL